MKRGLRIAAIAAVVVAGGVLLWRAWAPRASDADVLPGYIEGDDLYLSAPAAGTVGAVQVVKGQRVAAGAPLFAMDAQTYSAQQGQASARLAQSGAQVVQALSQARQAEASAAAARANEAEAIRERDRLVRLQRVNAQAVPAEQVDQARAAAAAATAQRRAAGHAAEAARLQADADRAGTAQSRESLREASVRLGQLAQRAPSAGRIQDVYYQRGEWAAANQPIVDLLPDDQVRLRFYVPQAALPAYRPGTEVRFGCDGCAAGLRARISYVSPQAEYTPPVIYSRKSREKLVFMVEARPLDPAGLAPGLPVDVVPLGGRR